MFFFKKKYKVDYDSFISILEKGNERDVKDLLWYPENGMINYLSTTIKLILKFKKQLPTDKPLTIYKQIEKGKYELIIFNFEGENSSIPYSPLIIDKSNGKIVGIMLPFNELHGYLTEGESETIVKLGITWTKFILDRN